MEESIKNVLVIETHPAGFDARLGVPLIQIENHYPISETMLRFRYVVSLEPVEFPNPGQVYTGGLLYVVSAWQKGMRHGVWYARVRSTHYFRRRMFHKPDPIQSLEDFNFMELAENILIRGEDRVDMGKSVVYTFNERRK